MFLEYLFTDLTLFVIALNFTRNICNLVRNHGDKIRALESRLVIEVT